ncbi:NrfD/PsrC family molybdoenzyme membrane anchor subunit [Pelagicoccus sp. SDUM812005]|uniref:NrfD/PsrC family molybdoenzyme membrane anchor subunit n=1 Tax=Pelagicoccus sp. SDUM812005 TaxID=3041257 RepID=UPI00280E826B|nr:NrfD/PsrC family molybdoenzyme membrane anchor subunit [Pelagicoccus sp. SDUM812005]MDQ8181573.1 polysulfide reductase NrfD [Pelagicoccus sp. SDUM812005]
MSDEIVYLTQSGPYWDWKVALDLFLGGAGVGALLFAILLDAVLHGKYRRICHTAAWLSPVLVSAGLLLIMIKMGRPFHAYHTYLNANLTSPLWWGGIFQPLVVGGGVVYAFLWNRPDQNVSLRRGLGWALAPLTLIVGSYHGMLLSTMVSHPLWNTGPTVIAALLSFATSGIAIVLLVHLARMKWAGRLDQQDHIATFLNDLAMVRNVMGALLILQLGTFVLWWLDLRLGGMHAQQALEAANRAYGPVFWGIGIGIGLILPLLLGLWSILQGEASHRRQQIRVIATSSALIVVGAFFFRLALVLAGQVPPAATSIF